MAEQTGDRVADWNDQSRERWVTHHARLDAMLAVSGEAAAPTTGERVLDVGCGEAPHLCVRIALRTA